MANNTAIHTKHVGRSTDLEIVLNSSCLERKLWSNFVYHHPQGNIFQTPEMYEVFNGTEGFKPILIAVLQDHRIKGIMLAVIQKEAKGVVGNFAKRSIIRGGPLIAEDDEGVLNLILQKYNSIVKNRILYSQIRNWTDSSINRMVFQKYGFRFIDHLNVLIDLTKPEKNLWQNINKKKRNRIRKAYREYLEFRQDSQKSDLAEAYNILKEVYHRIKLPYPKIEFFENLREKLSDQVNLLTFSVIAEGRIIATRFVLTFKKTLYVFYAGSYQKYNNRCANDLINWELILWGKNNGYTVFDFAGAGNPNIPYSVRSYKMKFGGEVTNPGRFEKVHHPILFHIAKRAFYLWQRFKA
ncbi:lipid II:glycine glycyltransferase FemX [Ancylomarina longa]|uniref:Peptidoglycan bridge formation glycyltransferase FemA/FemB family protein n=1 Tax=Ancylomarina longa TaxID=2487017 RepID=A0A434AZK0_9BACT|nr:peptidoglycan bridge formation glycyltransferase FemA/FemB family protein [Ancylomarina longa]RUT79877.1 peptidoglycan bridge formation glycyltransferase FemA/FemB family protein [Ancylomarina longa]